MAQGYTPDTRQRLTRATRFFARINSADLECPRCGTVYQIRVSPPAPSQAYWDATTSRFTCAAKSGCGKSYILGLVAWPLSTAPRVGTQTPSDQVPNERQLAQLRREGGGWWLGDEAAQRYARPHETNLTLEEDRHGDTQDEDED